MCGIAGIISASETPEAVELPLLSMQAALRHRGPDDQGEWVSPSRCAAFAHTRLSILDLTKAGHQPMSTPDGRFTIVFNGEIYNFRALREQFVPNVPYRSHSDTEVLLHLYESLGPECVSELRGMFAFAIWDERERTCLLARDPLGIKPLYYSCDSTRLVFASELRAVLASDLVPRRLDRYGALGLFRTGTVPEPATLIEGIYSLAAGTSLLWNNGKSALRTYWSLRFDCGATAVVDAPARVREALLDSVRHHFVSDVPVGLFLSGGIDSTAVLALSRAAGQQDLRTFSISFDDPTFNEGDLSQRTAEEFGTNHSDWRLKPDASRELFQQFLARLDQPSIDGFNTFAVAKLAHDQGMKVVLSGLGGDELFGGYPTFRKVPQILRAACRLGPLRPVIGRFLETSARPQFRRLGSFLRHPPNLPAAYLAYRGVYSQDEACALTESYCGVAEEPMDEVLAVLPAQPTLGDSVSAMELSLYMRNQLLRDSDAMSMAWGLELRVPFVDRVLVESLALIPAETRLQARKRLLLRAVPEIPEWVWNRPKRGFLFPLEKWLAGEWKEIFDSAVLRSSARAQTWYQKWSVFVFEHWCASHGVPLHAAL